MDDAHKDKLPLMFYGLKNYLGKPTTFAVQGAVGQGASPSSSGAGAVGAGSGGAGASVGGSKRSAVGSVSPGGTGNTGTSGIMGNVENALNAAQGLSGLKFSKDNTGGNKLTGEEGNKAPLENGGEEKVPAGQFNSSESAMNAAEGSKINPLDFSMGNNATKGIESGERVGSDIAGSISKAAGASESGALDAAGAGGSALLDASLAPETLGLTLIPAAASEALSHLPQTPHMGIDAALYAAAPWGALIDPALAMNAIKALTHGNVINNIEHMFGFGPPPMVGYPLNAWHQISSAVTKNLPKKINVPSGATPEQANTINQANKLIDDISYYGIEYNDPNTVPKNLQGVESPQAWQQATNSIMSYLTSKFNQLQPLYQKAYQYSMEPGVPSVTMKSMTGEQSKPKGTPAENTGKSTGNAKPLNKSTDKTLNSTFYRGEEKKKKQEGS